MKAFLDCIPCALRQALETVRRVTDDPAVQLAVMNEVNRRLATLDINRTPAALSRPAYQVVAELTGAADPYAADKRRHNQFVLDRYEHLKSLLDAAPNRLHRALQLAVAGNVIDLGIGVAFDIDREIERVLKAGFARDDSADLEAELAAGPKRILYMLDNAGEAVFDKLLIEELSAHQVTACVRGGPIINDVTMDDARQIGLTDVCRVITTGSNAVGVEWAETGDDLKEAFATADLIISKGQANVETLMGRPENLYFILKAKCQCVAREFGVRLGDVMIVHTPRA
ncbi:MAG TPA: ARMT1-like domain-containing protein [Phycisphaerae bacterium]|nr:ARMT1-like domain-containing protein [Phycisphaerae bacterium]